MDDISTDFCQRIQEKCRRQRWYGSDSYVPTRLQSELREGGTMFWYDRSGRQYPINRHTDTNKIPTVWAFEYAPLTEEQVQSTEQILGFSLPPLLRAIYTLVADGGFGPGYGLYHIMSEGENMINDYLSSKRRARPVDFLLFERRTPGTKLTMIPDYVWPNGFLCLCHWGCAIFSYLDIHSGRVFREAYYGDDQFGFEYEASSLEAWFELWLVKGMAMFSLQNEESQGGAYDGANDIN
jgi:hypothetical protein